MINKLGKKAASFLKKCHVDTYDKVTSFSNNVIRVIRKMKGEGEEGENLM